MQKDVLVTVVIPTYNRANIIINTIKSVLSQTYQNFEILVIDDGSTDNTKEVILGINDDRIKYFYQENAGAQAARNIGIKNAKSEWITFLDSDDEWFPEKLEWQVEILKENNYDKYVVIHSDAILKDTVNNMKKMFGIPRVNGDVYKALLTRPAPLFPALFTSKQALEEIGLLDEKVPSYQEWDTSIRLSKICKFIFMDKPTFIYYYHDGETISKGKKRDIEGYNYIINKHKNDIIKYCSEDTWVNHVIIQYRKCINWGFEKEAKEILKMLPFLYRLKNNIYRKEKIGNKRKITILGFIKISYKIKTYEEKSMKTKFLSKLLKKFKKKQNTTIQNTNDKKKYPICLSQSEREFLIKHIQDANHYLEFGSGGSTFLSLTETNIKRISSVESDKDWIEHLREWDIITDSEKEGRLEFIHANIGKTGEWGTPLELDKKELFANYTEKPFAEEKSYDTVFVDGRFRVACTLQAILNCDKNTKLIMHDFNNRPYYHEILNFLDIVDTADTMAVFKIKNNYNKDLLIEMYEGFKYNYD